MKAKERLLIRKEIGQEYLSNILDDGMTIEDVTKALSNEVEKYSKIYPEFTQIKMNFGYEYGYYDSCTFVVRFIGERFETDKEYEKRLQDNEKKAKVAKEEYKKSLIEKEEEEKALYQRLKEKFES